MSFLYPIIPRCTSSRIARTLSTTCNGTAAKVAQLSRIDNLLNLGREGTDESSRSGIPMINSSPWSGSRERQPWSFSFDPKGLPPPSPLTTPSSTPSSSDALRSSPTELEPRRMAHSYVEINLPLKSQPELLADYISTSGGLRVAKLMEHLDSLGGAVAYKHVLPANVSDFHDATQKAGVYLATAGADRLDLLKPLVISDLRLSGNVCYVGSSSMEVFVKMEALGGEGGDSTVLLGRFSMVARDSQTHKARKINPLLIETDAEKELFAIGREHKERKQNAKQSSLSRVPPTAEEISVLHELALSRKEKVRAGVEIVDMQETVTSADYLMHPQERNLHGMVFGGYLMKLATELSYSNAVLFARSPMKFLALDEISFSLPVPIGAILRLTATVIHSTSHALHSQVTAELVDVRSGKKSKTNTFYLTWGKEGRALAREVQPVSLTEGMAWLEGRRRLEQGSKLRSVTGA